MRGKIVFAGLVLGLSGFAAAAQDKPVVPRPSDIYCSGIVTSQSVPRDAYIITGEESNYRIIFDEGSAVYINKGTSQGVKVGDEFSVVREVKDIGGIEWTKWQNAILRKMGAVWEDEGRVKVIVARPDVSIAQIEQSCDFVQRGDLILPFVERPFPPLKPENYFDRFAPADGKPMAMIITGKKFQQQVGNNDIIYVNLGNDQGVKVGDYFRIFRYTGTQHETVFLPPRYAFDMKPGSSVPPPAMYGFGSVPVKYNWNNVPREDVGEGVVLRTGPNSATVLITFGLREIYPGDYVEIE
ncbi:MAG TPA: hypothetical protein VJO53_14100 [Candidatus Acidoferrales bacterium]|nr:hypothetical protein [Candidatus Acidoferrales bacterium]